MTVRAVRSDRPRPRAGVATLSVIAGCLSGCTVAPPMEPLPTHVDDAWTRQAGPDAVAQRADWWRELQDPVLDALIVRAIQTSPSLQSAAAKIAQAQGQMRSSGASRGPQLGVGGGINVLRVPPAVAERVDKIDPTILFDSLALQSSWELDFWGAAKNAARADAFAFLSTQQAYDAALVSLIGQLASAYIDFRTNQARLALARADAGGRAQSLRLAEARNRQGATDSSDPAQARLAAEQQEATVAALVLEVEQGRHAIALLVGTTDAEIAPMLAQSAPIPTVPAPPDAGVPNDLLRARPDVLQAELAARSQYARLSSARASLYPSFTLSGSVGLSGNTIGNGSLLDIFNWSGRTVSGGLSFVVPLFRRDRIVGQIEAQDAGFEQALQAYVQAVLAAHRDVADAQAQYGATRDTVAALSAATRESARLLRLANDRYEDGAATRQDILNAGFNDNATRDALLQMQGNAAIAYVTLNRSLGLGALAPGLPPRMSPETSERMRARTNWGDRLDELDGTSTREKPEQ